MPNPVQNTTHTYTERAGNSHQPSHTHTNTHTMTIYTFQFRLRAHAHTPFHRTAAQTRSTQTKYKKTAHSCAHTNTLAHHTAQVHTQTHIPTQNYNVVYATRVATRGGTLELFARTARRCSVCLKPSIASDALKHARAHRNNIRMNVYNNSIIGSLPFPRHHHCVCV